MTNMGDGTTGSHDASTREELAQQVRFLEAEVDALRRRYGPRQAALDEKLRQAYFWVVNHAIISPHYDIEYQSGPSASYSVGDTRRVLSLPSAQSYSSYVLLPLLTFATRRKCLFVGGPGRGKTASAILMGVLAGYPVREVRRAIRASMTAFRSSSSGARAAMTTLLATSPAAWPPMPSATASRWGPAYPESWLSLRTSPTSERAA